MREIVIAEHALKHGVAPEDIEYVWNHFVRKQYRGAPSEGEVVVVGYDRFGRLVELVAAERALGTIVYHAMEPPTKRVLRELGLERRKA